MKHFFTLVRMRRLFTWVRMKRLFTWVRMRHLFTWVRMRHLFTLVRMKRLFTLVRMKRLFTLVRMKRLQRKNRKMEMHPARTGDTNHDPTVNTQNLKHFKLIILNTKNQCTTEPSHCTIKPPAFNGHLHVIYLYLDLNN